jgi:hypothetical protein
MVTGLVFRPQADITSRCIRETTVEAWKIDHGPVMVDATTNLVSAKIVSLNLRCGE